MKGIVDIWFNPKSRMFIVFIIMLFLVAIACFKAGAITNGIICAIFGAVGIKIRIKETKK